jgi:hypothetical protein
MTAATLTRDSRTYYAMSRNVSPIARWWCNKHIFPTRSSAFCWDCHEDQWDNWTSVGSRARRIGGGFEMAASLIGREPREQRNVQCPLLEGVTQHCSEDLVCVWQWQVEFEFGGKQSETVASGGMGGTEVPFTRNLAVWAWRQAVQSWDSSS